jgi:hypothetical protein
MLKISVVKNTRRRRLIVEGKLVAPWTTELMTACEAARTDLHDGELIVDLRGVTAISLEGEDVLLQLMNEKVQFQYGVYMKEVLRQLARKSQRRLKDVGNKAPDGNSHG